MRAPIAIAIAFTSTLACSSTEGAGAPDSSPAALADAAAPDASPSSVDAAATLDAEATDVTSADAGSPDATGDDAAAADASITGPTFTADVFPMFESFGCTRVACHGSLRAQGGAVVYLPNREIAYADLYERRSIREPRLLVEPGNPEASVLFTHGRDENIRFGDLDAAGLALIGDWIRAGAPRGEAVVVTPPPPPTSCTVAELPGSPPLPAACLPRCTSDTWAAAIACRNQVDVVGCQNAVLAADTSTPTQLDFGPELGALPLDCSTCLDLQTETCFVELCLAEYLAATRCNLLDTRPTACGAEIAQVRACAQATPGFANCQASRDFMCVQP